VYILLGIVFLSICYIGFCFVKLNLKGTKDNVAESFEKATSFKIKEHEGWNTGVNRFKIGQLKASAEKLGVESASLRNISGDLGIFDFLRSQFAGENLKVSKADFVINWPLNAQEASLLKVGFPLHYGGGAIDSTNFKFTNDGKIMGGLEKARTVIRANSIRISDGKFSLFPFKNVNLTQANLKLEDQTVNVTDIKLQSWRKSSSFLLDSERETIILDDVSFNDFLSMPKSPYDIRMNAGAAECEAPELFFEPSSEGLSFAGQVQLSEVTLSKLNFLRLIDLHVEGTNYRNIQFFTDQFAQLDVAEGVIKLSELDIHSPGKMDLKGWIQVDTTKRNALSGRFELFLPAELVCNEYGNPVVRGFSAARDGTSKIEISLSGTLALPKDNLSKLVGNTWK